MRNSALLKKAIKKGLKIVHVDIETSPYLVWTYPLWETNISPDNIEVPMQVTSIGFMFEGDKKPIVVGWEYNRQADTGHFLVDNRDVKLLTTVIPQLEKADLLIGQNLDKYDIKKLNWRLNELGLAPLKNIVTIDILKQSRKVFSPASHKLDHRSKVYGFGGKIKQTMGDCIAVAKGDKKKQALRMKYNGKDVMDERKIFWRELDAYILPKSIIKMLQSFIAEEKPFCIKCAAKRQKRFDISIVIHNHERKYRCNQCDYTFKRKK